MRILIVEDETLLARNMGRYLERRGYEVTAEHTLASGSRRYEEAPPDIDTAHLAISRSGDLAIGRAHRVI